MTELKYATNEEWEEAGKWVEENYGPALKALAESEREDRLKEIKARVKAASDPPWFVCKDEYHGVVFVVYKNDDDMLQGDKEFLFHARQDVPFLLSEVERLKKIIEDDDGIKQLPQMRRRRKIIGRGIAKWKDDTIPTD